MLRKSSALATAASANRDPVVARATGRTQRRKRFCIRRVDTDLFQR